MSSEISPSPQIHEIISWDTDVCDFLLPQWGKYLFMEDSNIDKPPNHLSPPFLAVKTATVELIFHLCEHLLQPIPVYFLSVDLFDNFIRNHVAQLFEFAIQMQKGEKGFLKCWQMVVEKIESQLYLRILSSIQLASKIVYSGQSVTTSEIKFILERASQNYSIANIIKSEFRVFKTVGFRIPLSTALDMMEQLIEACAVPMELDPSLLYPVCIATLTLAYLQHSHIRSTYWCTAKSDKKEELGKDFQRLLAGASLLAACRIQNGERTTRVLSRHLSSHMRCAAPDITGLADIIVILALK